MCAYPQVPLGEICTINPRIRSSKCSPEDRVVSFVPMAAVDERFGMIAVREDRLLSELSEGYTAFANDDILFAKITPCMENGKIALVRNLTSGVGRGSTEFFVLRPSDRVLVEYVFHLLRQSSFREAAKRSFTGTAGQQRVPKAFMENTLVPLPPIEVQRKIIAILNRAAHIDYLRTQVTDYLQEFKSALFMKIFGDPIDNPYGWVRRKLVEVSEVQGGLQVTRKRFAQPLERPYLRVANVLRDQLVLADVKYIRLTSLDSQRSAKM